MDTNYNIFISNMQKLNLNECDVKAIEIISERLQKNIEGKVQNDTYNTISPEISQQCNVVLRRSQEWKNDAFFAIVVGPVKSGKSTFVNLLAHEKVSPTHFLECTVKPSIISRKKRGESSQIVPFKVTGKLSIDDVDSIIDYIKGLNYADLGHITKDSPSLLNNDNLDALVAYHIDFGLDGDGRIALTSITAEGGKFLQDNIYLIDMPGFDGRLASLEDDYYQAIINRADLVFFVQSSNSAINRISDEFCRMIRERNGTVPVFFIHNYFDSASWRTNQIKNKDADEQIQQAKKFFEEKGLSISEDVCVRINLGMVTDARDKDFIDDQQRCCHKYVDVLQEEESMFCDLENRFYEIISAQKNRMRLVNCINRTLHEITKLRNFLADEKKHLEDVGCKYEQICIAFENIEKSIKPIDIATVWKQNYDAELVTRLAPVCKNHCEIIDEELNYDTDRTRSLAQELIQTYVNTTKAYLESKVDISKIQDDICTKAYSHFTSIIPDDLTIKTLRIEYRMEKNGFQYNLSSIYDQYNVKDEVKKWHIKTRKGADVVVHMKDIAQRLFGQSQNNPCGYIPNQLWPSLEKQIENRIKNIINNYYEGYCNKVKTLKKEELDKLIPNYDKHIERIKQITALVSDLNTIIGTIN